MSYIHIATEDELSEAVAERLVRHCTGREVHLRLRRNGYGYLRVRLGSFAEMAQRTPVLLLTDLDTKPCPSALLAEWWATAERAVPDTLLLRVAVREIESWLLADHPGMTKLLGVRKLPDDPDALSNPKMALLRLAEKAPREIRDDLTVKRDVMVSQGLGYNARLTHFVRTTWYPERAAERSESLRRCCERLKRIV